VSKSFEHFIALISGPYFNISFYQTTQRIWKQKITGSFNFRFYSGSKITGKNYEACTEQIWFSLYMWH
jgi:hypothetical protein